jgi:hypothetical protein
LIIAVNAMAVLPVGVKYLSVKRSVADILNEGPQIPLAADLSLAVALLIVCSVIFLRYSSLDRNVNGLIILLLGLLVPYIISPLPKPEDIVKVSLGVAVIAAVWSIGAPVDGLKWVPIIGSAIGIYSIIGGLIIPEYMNVITDPTKLIIPNWQLAGPFIHGNFLGIYCVLALALTPLIASVRWRILNGLILCTTIVAAASRTALFAAGILALWWMICYFRSMISLRLAGTALVGCCAAAVVMLPLLNSNPHAFVGRGYAWATGLSEWQKSPLVGKGINFVAGLSYGYDSISSSWDFHHGHNLFVDTLLRSGLVGICVLLLVLLAAIRSTRAFDVSSHQIAFFGYLITFLVASSTEAIWVLIPTKPLFPVVGLVFAVLICRELGRRPGGTSLASTKHPASLAASGPETSRDRVANEQRQGKPVDGRGVSC